jgi:hypothetical protein
VQGYELTERGKILVVVIAAAILFTLSAVLMIRARANQPMEKANAEPSASPPTAHVTTTPAATESPPPSGGGFDDIDITATPTDDEPKVDETTPPIDNGSNGEDVLLPSNGNGANGDDEITTNGQDDNHTSTELINENSSKGTLTFSFSPDYQNELDSETKTKLVELMRSSNYSQNSVIAVETAPLSSDYSEKLMTAVVNAFAEHGVPDNRISHVQRNNGAVGEIIEVSLRIITTGGK